ncbi:hypothetical protein KZ829_05755 [Actinoplanes hulinensis]|uniref:EfeO-type cupredoxin-like domain-containing protein n=1 Tax=Actinoplanes hulinensis TaxID=1144547 RepID=A0ABS7AWZ2_9ACTN|nr:hypothetical protein [Actinoplanes hulinensis]MBW6433248.1 hypothetical protein [Actinoplanes hulinensis]
MMLDLRRALTVKRWVAGGTAVACVWATAGSHGSEFTPVGTYTFAVDGTPVRDLHPGATARTRVTVVNPFPFLIRVHSIDARLSSASARRCKPVESNLRVGPHRGRLPLTVPAHGRRSAGEFEVMMPNTAADTCQSATFRLALTATATEVKR